MQSSHSRPIWFGVVPPQRGLLFIMTAAKSVWYKLVFFNQTEQGEILLKTVGLDFKTQFLL